MEAFVYYGSMLLGSLVYGAFFGAIPFGISRKRGSRKLGNIAMGSCIVGSFLLGLRLSIPLSFGFSAYILFATRTGVREQREDRVAAGKSADLEGRP